jgi:hypothetical protein
MDGGHTISAPFKKLLTIEFGRREILRGLGILLLLSFVFLFFRLVFKGFGANPLTPFVGLVYLISSIFLIPFFGIFPEPSDPGTGAAFDTTAMIGMFSYLIFVTVAMVVVQVVAAMLKTKRQVKETLDREQSIDARIVDEAIE